MSTTTCTIFAESMKTLALFLSHTPQLIHEAANSRLLPISAIINNTSEVWATRAARRGEDGIFVKVGVRGRGVV